MAEARITFHPERRGTGTIRLTETHWGYILREAAGPLGGAKVAEAALCFFAVVLVGTSYVQWLLPSSAFPEAAGMARIVFSGGLAVVGAALFLLARRGLTYEVHVDREKRELRFVRCGGGGRSRVLRRLPFSAVESVYVRRHEGADADFRLRVKGAQAPVHVAFGAERDLNLLHSRLCRDLKSPAERIEARLRVVPPRKVAVRLRQAG